jgi:predicted permease
VACLLTVADAASIVAFSVGRRTGSLAEGVAVTGSELRLSLRRLRQAPLLSLTAVVTLGVGMALALTGFTVVEAIHDPRLPFPGGERWVEVVVRDAETRTVRGGRGLMADLRGPGAGLEHLGAVEELRSAVAFGPGSVELVGVSRVTPGTLAHLPFRPRAGRLLGRADGDPGAEPVALLGAELWERRFGSDPSVVGRRIEVGGVRTTVVGVLPPEAVYPGRGEIWLPHDGSSPARPGSPGAPSLVGVLEAGTEPPAVARRLQARARAWAGNLGVDDVEVEVHRVGESARAGGPGALLVAVALGLLVVIAANVANLVRARTAARRDELAVRSALGAGRGRLVGQLSLEVLVMGVLAALLGLAASRWVLAMARREGDLPPWMDLTFDPWSAGFVVALALLATLVAGVFPALRSTRADLAPGLQAGGRGSVGRVFGPVDEAVIVAQVALAVGVLGAAVMIHRGWSAAYDRDRLPVPATSILAARVTLPPGLDPDSVQPLRRAIAATAGDLGEVAQVGTASHLPGWDAPLLPVEVEGGGAGPATDAGSSHEGVAGRVRVAHADAGYFAALEVGPLRGRLTTHGAPAGAEVVVNRSFVQRRLGGGHGIGRRVRLASGDGGPGPWLRIVGVVPDLGLSATDPGTAAGIYLPPGPETSFWVVARSRGAAAPLGPPLQTALYGLDPRLATSGTDVLSRRYQARQRVYVVMGTAVTSLGGLVLLLSLMGVYALLSFDVTRRRREIGVRVALGASSRAVLRPILGRVAAYLALGGALGTALGVGLLQVVRATLVMDFPPVGPGAFLALLTLLAATSGLAAWLPIRRTLGIEPMEALRVE